MKYDWISQNFNKNVLKSFKNVCAYTSDLELAVLSIYKSAATHCYLCYLIIYMI